MRWPKPSASTVFTLLMLASVLLLFLPPAWLNTFRTALNSLATPPAAGANRILHWFSGPPPAPEPVDTDQLQKLVDRLRQLERQNAFLHNRWMEAVDLYARSQYLDKRLLLGSYSLVPANVCGYNLPGQAAITIDQGSIAGLEVGFWVVAVMDTSSELSGRALLESSILVGRIRSVQTRTAQVRLLGDPNQPPISALVYKPSPGTELQPWALGVKVYIRPLHQGLLLARDVPNKELSADDELDQILQAVVVSDDMQNVPIGLAIGRVTKIEPSPRNMLFSDLTIEPLVRSLRLSSVMVLRPARSPG